MLPRRHRITAASDFAQAIRGGRRFGTRTLVAHYWCCGDEPAPRIGFAVGKPVGNSVVRHRVVRRLRHLAATRIEAMPAGSLLVVRANPAAGSASSRTLGTDLDRAVAAFKADR